MVLTLELHIFISLLPPHSTAREEDLEGCPFKANVLDQACLGHRMWRYVKFVNGEKMRGRRSRRVRRHTDARLRPPDRPTMSAGLSEKEHMGACAHGCGKLGVRATSWSFFKSGMFNGTRRRTATFESLFSDPQEISFNITISTRSRGWTTLVQKRLIATTMSKLCAWS